MYMPDIVLLWLLACIFLSLCTSYDAHARLLVQVSDAKKAHKCFILYSVTTAKEFYICSESPVTVNIHQTCCWLSEKRTIYFAEMLLSTCAWLILITLTQELGSSVTPEHSKYTTFVPVPVLLGIAYRVLIAKRLRRRSVYTSCLSFSDRVFSMHDLIVERVEYRTRGRGSGLGRSRV